MFAPRKRVNVHRLDGFHLQYHAEALTSLDGKTSAKQSEGNEAKKRVQFEEWEFPSTELQIDDDRTSVPLDFRLRAFEAYVIQEGISEGGVKRLIAMMELVYDQEPPFSFAMYQSGMRKLKKQIVSKSVFLCGSCGSQKNGRTSLCTECYSEKPRLLDTTTIVVLNVKHQLCNFLQSYASHVIEGHQMIHNSADTFDKYDTRRYSGYQDALETNEEFNRGVVHLVCSVSSDGAKYKRLSRREITPTFLRVECGPPFTKRGGKNMTLLAMTFATGGVKKSSTDAYIENTLSQLAHLSLVHNVSDRPYLFKVVIMGYVADMKEINLLTTLPNWHEKQGCGICVTSGSKKPNGKISFNDSTPAVLRTDDSILYSARTGTSGFRDKKIPKVYGIVQPTAFQIDPFHIRSAGVCADYLSEIIRPQKWTKCKLKTGRMEALKESFDKCENNTNDRVKLQSLRHRTRCTGRETEKMCLYACALTSFTLSFHHPDFNVFSLGLYYTLTFLGSTLEHDRGALRLLLAEMYKLHVHLETNSCTIKWHCYYQHLIEHEEKFGPVYTTEVYEREHRNLMTSVNQNTTNCEEFLPMRYVANQQLKTELWCTIGGMDGTRQRNLHGMLRMNREQHSPSTQPSAALHFNQLNEAHQRILVQKGYQNSRFLKRTIVTNSTRNFFLSSVHYWKTARTTQDKFCWIDSSSKMMQFGKALVIFDENQERFVMSEEYVLEPFQETRQRFSDTNLSTESLNVLNACSSFPTTFAKVTAPAVTVCIDDDVYIKLVL